VAAHSSDREGRLREVLAERAAIRPGDRALDLCTGTGAMLPALAQRAGAHGLVVGLDFSGGMLEQARRKRAHGPGVALVLADAEYLPFRDGTLDAVTCSHAFYELKGGGAERALAEVARTLRPDGRFLMMEHEVPDRPLLRLLFYIRLLSMGLRKAFEVLGHEETLFRRHFPVVERIETGTGRSKIIMAWSRRASRPSWRGQPMSGVEAFGKDEGTVHLGTDTLRVADLWERRGWQRQLRNRLRGRPLVWFVDDELANREWFVRAHRSWAAVLTMSDPSGCDRAFDRGTPCDAVVTDIFFPSAYPATDSEANDLLGIYRRIEGHTVGDLPGLWNAERSRWSLSGFAVARKADAAARSRGERIPVLLFSRKAALLLGTDDLLGEPVSAVQNSFWLVEKTDPSASADRARRAAAIQRERIIAALRYRRSAAPWWRKLFAWTRIGPGYGPLGFDLGPADTPE
jgi:SAM-dependent methyltransferase